MMNTHITARSLEDANEVLNTGEVKKKQRLDLVEFTK